MKILKELITQAAILAALPATMWALLGERDRNPDETRRRGG